MRKNNPRKRALQVIISLTLIGTCIILIVPIIRLITPYEKWKPVHNWAEFKQKWVDGSFSIPKGSVVDSAIFLDEGSVALPVDFLYEIRITLPPSRTHGEWIRYLGKMSEMDGAPESDLKWKCKGREIRFDRQSNQFVLRTVRT